MIEKSYTMQEILDALKRVEEHHFRKREGMGSNPDHDNTAHDLFTSSQRRMRRALAPEDYGPLDNKSSRRILRGDLIGEPPNV